MEYLEMFAEVIGTLIGKFIKSFVYTAGVIAAYKILM